MQPQDIWFQDFIMSSEVPWEPSWYQLEGGIYAAVTITKEIIRSAFGQSEWPRLIPHSGSHSRVRETNVTQSPDDPSKWKDFPSSPSKHVPPGLAWERMNLNAQALRLSRGRVVCFWEVVWPETDTVEVGSLNTLSQVHLNSVFHNSWHLILIKTPCYR